MLFIEIVQILSPPVIFWNRSFLLNYWKSPENLEVRENGGGSGHTGKGGIKLSRGRGKRRPENLIIMPYL